MDELQVIFLNYYHLIFFLVLFLFDSKCIGDKLFGRNKRKRDTRFSAGIGKESGGVR